MSELLGFRSRHPGSAFPRCRYVRGDAHSLVRREVCAPSSLDVLSDPILSLKNWLPRVSRDSIVILGFEHDHGTKQVTRINFVN
jgi:hypothetical protein